MKNTEITYWLSPAGECKAEILVMTTVTSKVPEIGEVIHFNTKFDFNDLALQYSGLGENWSKLLPLGETQIQGEFLVVNTKRWLKNDIQMSCLKTNKNTYYGPKASPVECFEVIIEPFKETTLTEAPIAKLRNSLSPVFGVVDLMTAIIEHPDKEKELLELLKGSLETARECISNSRELLRNDKNWKQ